MITSRYEIAGLKCLEVSPDDTTKTELPLVVVLHGRGDWGESYEDIAPAISTTGYRFVFPTAPLPLPGALFEWFRLEQPNLSKVAAGARTQLTRLLDELRQRYNTPAARTVLGGFSQGGMMTLEVGLRYPEKLAGLIALSSFLVADSQFDWMRPLDPTRYYGRDAALQEVMRAAAKLGAGPVFIGHGTFDPVVPLVAGQATRDYLTQNGLKVEYFEFQGGHEINLAELNKIKTFLAGVLK